MVKRDFDAIYQKLKFRDFSAYKEEVHCPMLMKVMANPNKGTYSAFCVEAEIDERKFYRWLSKHELFRTCYSMARMFAKENWEAEGRALRDEIMVPGTSNHKFEYWRQVGWMRFGIGKNSRIRLELDPDAKPNEHYAQLLKQAAEGEFTAGEIKQLMEAINVGLSAHQVIALQKEIDQLKSDLALMNENTHGDNSFAAK